MATTTIVSSSALAGTRTETISTSKQLTRALTRVPARRQTNTQFRCSSSITDRGREKESAMTDITAGRVAGSAAAGRAEYPIKRIIFASGLGTMIEWYDFYIF